MGILNEKMGKEATKGETPSCGKCCRLSKGPGNTGPLLGQPYPGAPEASGTPGVLPGKELRCWSPWVR